MPIIEVTNLSKRYGIGLKEKRADTFAGQLLSVLKAPIDNFRQLRSLSKFGGRTKAFSGPCGISTSAWKRVKCSASSGTTALGTAIFSSASPNQKPVSTVLQEKYFQAFHQQKHTSMADTTNAVQLHQRWARGETLTVEEQDLLNKWYAEQDAIEATEVPVAKYHTYAIETQQKQLAEMLNQIAVSIQRIMQIAAENEQLKQENEQLKRLLSHGMHPLPA